VDLNSPKINQGGIILLGCSLLVLAALILLMVTYAVTAQPQAKPYTIAYDRVVFMGRITTEAVDSLVKDAEGVSIDTLVINSQGGEVRAAVRLANWVLDRGLDVRVDRTCMSSCANYVFVAGKKKILEPGALLLWHGGANQRNFREFRSQYESALARRAEGSATATDDALLASESIAYGNQRETADVQRQFYTRIGVDEKFLLIGQEPVAFDTTMWSVTPSTLARFKIKDVILPADYGTGDYLKRWKSLTSFKGKLVTLEVDVAGNISQVAGLI
jgi:hypothetical protein